MQNANDISTLLSHRMTEENMLLCVTVTTIITYSPRGSLEQVPHECSSYDKILQRHLMC